MASPATIASIAAIPVHPSALSRCQYAQLQHILTGHLISLSRKAADRLVWQDPSAHLQLQHCRCLHGTVILAAHRLQLTVLANYTTAKHSTLTCSVVVIKGSTCRQHGWFVWDRSAPARSHVCDADADVLPGGHHCDVQLYAMLTTMTMHLHESATLYGPLHSEGSAYSSARQSACTGSLYAGVAVLQARIWIVSDIINVD